MIITNHMSEQMKNKITSKSLDRWGKNGNLQAIKFHLSELTQVGFEVPKHLETQTIELLQQEGFGILMREETIGGNILLIGSTEW